MQLSGRAQWTKWEYTLPGLTQWSSNSKRHLTWPMGANLTKALSPQSLQCGAGPSGPTASLHCFASTVLHYIQLVSQPVIKSYGTEYARLKGKDALLSYSIYKLCPLYKDILTWPYTKCLESYRP